MSNIWEFLYQTASASVTAVLLLVIRRMFDGKLSARFMCFSWSVLILRILVPASISRDTAFPMGFWAEYIKSICEKRLSSAYSEETVVISLISPFPYITGTAKSVTDVLFLAYAVGVCIFLIVHAFSYIKLQAAVKKSFPVSNENAERVRAVSEKYSFKPCHVREADVATAFVCGVFRPVLVLPKGEVTDEKIIIHEMLHIKYGDVAVGVFLCLLRSLHWCNPLIHYVFSRIEDDMETLCDYRVLELLSGEERREYAQLLLLAATKKYMRAVGSSSVLGRGKHFTLRIENIVRFKKYPRGMAVVSICIVIVMSLFCVVGTRAVYDEGLYEPQYSQRDEAYVMARLNRCRTPEGAIDTFAKSKIYGNYVYLAMCSPMDMQESIKNHEVHPRDEDLLYATESYFVLNMQEMGKDMYSAYVAINVSAVRGDDGDFDFNEGCVFIPVKIYKENGFVVEEAGKREYFSCPYYGGNVTPPVAKQLIYKSKLGKLDMAVSVLAMVNNRGEGLIFPNHLINIKTPQTDCVFESSTVQLDGTFEFFDKSIFEGKEYFSVVICVSEEEKENASLPQAVIDEIDQDSADQGVYLCRGKLGDSVYEWYRYAKYKTSTLQAKEISEITVKNNYNFGYDPCTLPSSLDVFIVADGEVMECFKVEVK